MRAAIPTKASSVLMYARAVRSSERAFLSLDRKVLATEFFSDGFIFLFFRPIEVFDESYLLPPTSPIGPNLLHFVQEIWSFVANNFVFLIFNRYL